MAPAVVQAVSEWERVWATVPEEVPVAQLVA